MNETITKFGYPETLVSEYEHWVVLLRPQQVTLGSLILACKEGVESFGEISSAAGFELARVARDIENTLGSTFGYDKINYLMLMMIDPHVHFHVFPRYSDTQQHEGLDFADRGWPGPPKLDHVTELSAKEFDALVQHLIVNWPEVGR